MSETEPLVEKYRPEKWGDVQGNNTAIKRLRQWAQKWDRGDSPEPQMLAGPPGVGKTSTVQVMANEMGWPIEEINASDARRTDEIASIAERMKLTPIGADHQLVLLDEADSIPGSTNLKPLKDVLKDPPNPIIVVCNDDWEVPSAIKRQCNDHDFKLSKSSRMAKLKKINKSEGLELDMSEMAELSKRENLRDAIQDLQSMGRDGQIFEDERQYGASPFEVLDDLRTGETIEGQIDETPEDLHRWLDSGLRGQYNGWEAQVVWDLLARSDKWLQRARTEDYRYWKYASLLQKQIAEVRLTEPYTGYVRYGSPNYNRPPSAKSESNNTATLFRELSGMEDGRPGLTCDYHEFRHIYLPYLTDLDLEKRRQMAVEHGLSDSAKKALDLDPDQHEDWATSEGEKIEENSVFDW